jgi:uncharacterized protein (DUF1697 family)
MKTFISILRGINVSGQKKIRMADLTALYQEQNLRNVITYIQSGNVIFTTGENATPQTLSKKIELAIKKKYRFDVPVIIRTAQEIKKTIFANPFLKRSDVDKERLYVTFLEEHPEDHAVENIRSVDYTPEEFVIKNREIFLYCPNGYGNAKLSNNFFENKLKITATTRNWRTVNTLLAMATDK